MTEEQKTDGQLIAHEISRIPSTVGVPVQDVQKALNARHRGPASGSDWSGIGVIRHRGQTVNNNLSLGVLRSE